jgi:serine/threonine protein kinase
MAVDPARAKSLFLVASDLADAADRAAYLDRECSGDAELRARVEVLLLANDAAPVPGPRPADAAGSVDPAAPTTTYPGKDELTGAVIAGKYTLVEPIGEGGMGAVWRAKQTEPVKRFVAVKLIKAGMDSKQVLARFDAERQALALMDHPNIAKVLDGGVHDGRPFFVMELVKGVPITQYSDVRRLTPRERLELFVGVCQAVQHAHQKGVIHRDIKPSNVLVALYDDRPVVKVIDFGVAKATGAALTDSTIDTGFGGLVGTPEYMSPEQATFNNLDIDTRSDVFALGVLLYELLTGSPPFTRKELETKGLLEMLRVVREEEPPRPSTRLSSADALPTLSVNRATEPKKLTALLKNELDWVVMRALEKERSRRYETANGFAADVLRYLAGEPVQAHPPSATYRLKKFVQRNRPQVIAATVVLVALVTGVVGATLGLVQANRAAAAERVARDNALEQKHLAEQAAEQERQAKVREAQRADGEQKAKLEADAKRKEAERNLAFARKGNEILGSVFAGLDPSANYATVADLRSALRDNLKKAVKDLEGSAIGEPLEVAAMQETLGKSLYGLGESFLAVEVHTKALATRKAKLGPNHAHTLYSMNDLAGAYQASGQLSKAVSLFEETLEKMKTELGPDHPHTLTGMNNLGRAYLASEQVAKAVPLFEVTLEKMKSKLGLVHPNTLTCMHNLAIAYQASGQLAKAVPLYEMALEKRKAELGPDHPDTLSSSAGLALAYQASGEFAKAVPLLEKTLEKARAKLGADHFYTLASMNNLATAYLYSGQSAKAVPLCEEALEKMKAKLGADHPETLNSMNTLAGAYTASGQLTKAVTLHEETLEKVKAKAGPDHPSTLLNMNNLALAYQATDQLAKAAALLEQSLQKHKARFGAEHVETLRTMAALGWILLKQKKWADAEPVLRDCLPMGEKLIPDNWRTFNTQSMLGGALLGQKKYAEAEPLLVKGYAGMKTREQTIPKAGVGALVIPEALDRLIELYTATGKPDEVTKWRAERQKYPAAAPTPRSK